MAVEEAQVQGLRSRVLHVAVLARAVVHLARGDETTVARHLRMNVISDRRIAFRGRWGLGWVGGWTHNIKQYSLAR